MLKKTINTNWIHFCSRQKKAKHDSKVSIQHGIQLSKNSEFGILLTNLTQIEVIDNDKQKGINYDRKKVLQDRSPTQMGWGLEGVGIEVAAKLGNLELCFCWLCKTVSCCHWFCGKISYSVSVLKEWVQDFLSKLSAPYNDPWYRLAAVVVQKILDYSEMTCHS